jgi:hypothetical protein
MLYSLFFPLYPNCVPYLHTFPDFFFNDPEEGIIHVIIELFFRCWSNRREWMGGERSGSRRRWKMKEEGKPDYAQFVGLNCR